MWKPENDTILKTLILENHIYDWDKLANYFGSSIKEIKMRWVYEIAPTFRTNKKIAGAYLWTTQEDIIIRNYNKKLEDIWQNLMDFLPDRTNFSIEARWKRITKKNSDIKEQRTKVERRRLIKKNHKLRLQQYQKILQLRKKLQSNSEMECQTLEEAKKIEIQ